MEEKREQIKLSCLITNYNEIEWIGEAVDSILRQRIDYPYEILIGDDGSNDGSLELIQEKYGQLPQVRILVQERQEGVKEYADWRHSRLIFRLLDESRGEYVSILDGDDHYCGEDHFQHKIELLEKEENRDCAACYGGMYTLEDGELKLYTSIPYSAGRYRWQKDNIYVHLATAVIRKKALEDVPRHIYYEQFVDWEVTTWVIHKGLLYYDPTPCFVYRVLPNSIFHGASENLNALRSVISCDLNYQAYGGNFFNAYKIRRKPILTLYQYHKKRFFDDEEHEMWNAYTVRYHTRLAHMLLNRDSLKLTEKIWLAVFCLRLKAPWEAVGKRLMGYGIGIGQLIDPKVSEKEKKKLLQNWWKRIAEKR